MKLSISFMVAFLLTIFLFNTTSLASTFSDVSGHKYENAITYVQEEEIVNGFNDGTYRPDEKINRAEFLTILINSKNIDSSEVAAECFSDVIDNKHAHNICRAKELGIIGGYPDKTYKPENSVNFVQALKIILNTYEVEVSETDPWYKGYINVASEMNIIPLDIQSFDQELTRGQVADMIIRYLKYIDGSQTDYLESSFDDISTVTYDELLKNDKDLKNREQEGMPSKEEGQRPPTPPEEALTACENLSEDDTCSFTTPDGDLEGICVANLEILACAPAQ